MMAIVSRHTQNRSQQHIGKARVFLPSIKRLGLNVHQVESLRVMHAAVLQENTTLAFFRRALTATEAEPFAWISV
jgi:hypothetical protein